MPLERLAQEPFGGSQIAPLAEPEFDRVAMAIDSSVEVHPASFDLDVSFIGMPFPTDGSLPEVEAVQRFG